MTSRIEPHRCEDTCGSDHLLIGLPVVVFFVIINSFFAACRNWRHLIVRSMGMQCVVDVLQQHSLYLQSLFKPFASLDASEI